MNGILIPQNVFVGDTAQFLFLLSEQVAAELAAQKFNFDEPIPLKQSMQNDSMTVLEIRIVKRDNGHYLLITFVPWETGDISFPPLLNLKNTLPVVHVSSLLENTDVLTLQPPKSPVLIPGTDYLLYGLAAGGLGLFLICAIGFSVLLRKMLRKKVVIGSKKRLIILKRKLRQLYKETRKIQNKIPSDFNDTEHCSDNYDKTGTIISQWYGALDRVIRNYLYSLFMEELTSSDECTEGYFASATYSELTDKLVALFGAQQGIVDIFTMFYTMLEKQRFGSSRTELLRNYSATAHDMLKKVPYMAEKTEMEYAALIRLRKEAENKN